MISTRIWPGRQYTFIFLVVFATTVCAQQPPYDVFPDAEPPYYRVRYEASTQPGELSIPVNYTIWIPSGVDTLRGVIVHQHGCGEGSCKSGLTGAFDLHWQALARKHNSALLAPSYEQPQELDCQLWCDPRNGSDLTFQRSLSDLGVMSGHPELADAPWALWGHSGGGTWAGVMTLIHPERVAATWLRSGCPALTARPDRPSVRTMQIPDEPLEVPIMCNLGTEEGYSVKEGRFAQVWPAMERFFKAIRKKGGLIGVAIDPLTSHACGNQRYLAIPWFDACLEERLPLHYDQPLRTLPNEKAWLAALPDGNAWPVAQFSGNRDEAVWLPNERIAKAWGEYIQNTQVTDRTPPPAPTNLQVSNSKLSWQCEADLESGLARFIIVRDGNEIASLPEDGKNSFGRPIFQGLQYSDTPQQPLVHMQFLDTSLGDGSAHVYSIVSENTVGLRSK